MSIVPFIAAAPFVLVGGQLFRIARKSHALPDKLLAAFFLLLAVGVVPRITAVDRVTRGGQDWTTFVLSAVADLLIGSALVCLVAFTWKVFRPEQAWARRLTVGFAVAIAFAAVIGKSSIAAAGASQPASILFNFIVVAGLSWAFVECSIYRRQMRRRVSLGMADPVVANRFVLWSIWTGAIALQGVLQVALRVALYATGAGEVLAAGEDPGGPWLGLIVGIKSMLVVVAPSVVISVWLSFSPPKAYLSWLRGDQPEPASV